MFKSRTIRTGLSLARGLPVRIVNRRGLRYESEIIRVQRVNLRQRRSTAKKAYTLLLWTSAFWAYFHYIFPTIEDGDEHQVRDDEHDEDDLEPLFIPLWLAKAQPRTLYKDTDPEMQEYVKFSADRQRRVKVRLELFFTVLDMLMKDPRAKMSLGDADRNAVDYWLDETYPAGPPIEYERPGIEIGDDSITWTTRPVDQDNYLRFNNVIWPQAVASSFYASFEYLAWEHTRRLKEYLGLSSSPQSSLPGRKSSAKAKPSQTNPIASAEPPQLTTSSSSSSPSPSGSQPPANTSSSSGANTKEQKVGLPQIGTPQPSGLAILPFLRTLSRRWQTKTMSPPRGVIIFSGLVSIKTKRALCTLDVNAWYDPKENKFVRVEPSIRSIKKIRVMSTSSS